METDWRHAYDALAKRLPEMARTTPLTLCGMSACVDARVDLSDAAALWSAEDREAAAFAAGCLLVLGSAGRANRQMRGRA